MNDMDEQLLLLRQFGVRIGTRKEGSAARQVIVDAIQALAEPARLVISLDGIQVLSGSFADEAIGICCLRLAAGEYGDRYMVLSAPLTEVIEDLSHKLERRDLAILCEVDNEWSVLGALSPAMEETLSLMIKRQHATAKELAELLDIEHNTCLHRLGKLVDLRLVGRKQIGQVGPYPSYRFFSIVEC